MIESTKKRGLQLHLSQDNNEQKFVNSLAIYSSSWLRIKFDNNEVYTDDQFQGKAGCFLLRRFLSIFFSGYKVTWKALSNSYAPMKKKKGDIIVNEILLRNYHFWRLDWEAIFRIQSWTRISNQRCSFILARNGCKISGSWDSLVRFEEEGDRREKSQLLVQMNPL